MLPWLLTLLALGSVPGLANGPLSADAWAESIETAVGPASLRVSYHLVYEGTDAGLFRARLDRDSGDGDGRVEPAEADAYAASWALEDVRTPGCLATVAHVRMRGGAAERLVSSRTELVGAAGPVTSAEPVVERIHLIFEYAASAGPPTVHVRFADWDHWAVLRECLGDGPAVNGLPIAQGHMSHNAAGDGTRWSMAPEEGAAFDAASFRPSEIVSLLRDGRLEARTGDEVRRLTERPVEARLVSCEACERPDATGDDRTAPASAGVPLVAAVLAASALGWRWAPVRWTLAGVGLAFSRMERGEALLHARRQEILELVEAEPGSTLVDLGRALGMARGSLAHHLRILRDKGYVRRVRIGRRTLFYPRGESHVDRPYVSAYQKRLLERVRQEPGLTQTDLLREIGPRRDQVSYHLRRLERLGLLETLADGRSRRYYPAAEARN